MAISSFSALLKVHFLLGALVEHLLQFSSRIVCSRQTVQSVRLQQQFSRCITRSCQTVTAGDKLAQSVDDHLPPGLRAPGDVRQGRMGRHCKLRACTTSSYTSRDVMALSLMHSLFSSLSCLSLRCCLLAYVRWVLFSACPSIRVIILTSRKDRQLSL